MRLWFPDLIRLISIFEVRLDSLTIFGLSFDTSAVMLIVETKSLCYFCLKVATFNLQKLISFAYCIVIRTRQFDMDRFGNVLSFGNMHGECSKFWTIVAFLTFMARFAGTFFFENVEVSRQMHMLLTLFYGR